MTPSDLKYTILGHHPESFFFDRKTMKFFGDTMANYGVRAKPVTVANSRGIEHTCWELYRKRAVKHGLGDSTFFDTTSLKRIIPA
jgi:hypothetical protein